MSNANAHESPTNVGSGTHSQQCLAKWTHRERIASSPSPHSSLGGGSPNTVPNSPSCTEVWVGGTASFCQAREVQTPSQCNREKHGHRRHGYRSCEGGRQQEYKIRLLVGKGPRKAFQLGSNGMNRSCLLAAPLQEPSPAGHK